MKKILLFGICLFFLGNYLFAQVLGDYLSIATGLWNNSANWQRHDGNGFVAATDYPGQAAGTGNVTIANGNSLILPVSPAFPIGAVTFQEGDDYSDLIINDGFILNVTGAVLINPPTINVGRIKQVVLNGGSATLNCASVTIVPSDDDVRLARIQFSNGGILNVTGDITMGINTPLRTNILFFGGGGTLNIGGSIIGGDITPGSGTVNFNGNGVQILGGVLAKQMYSMGMTNAASTLQLAVNLTLHGTLTLTAGKINTGTNTLTLDNSTPANQLSGGSSSSYVYSTGAGRLRRNDILSSTTYGFPVGTSSIYMPVLITPTTGGAHSFSVNVFTPASTNGVEGGPAFVDKSKIVDAVWNIDRPLGTGDVGIDIQWNDALEGATFASFGNSQIGISRNDAGTWLPAVAVFVDASLNLASATFNTFSPFGIGQINVALPVTFGSFEAYEKQKGIQLDWKVYSEDKVKNYEVERSADAVTFTVIGSLPALYNHGSGGNYDFFDADPLPGVSFYRIKNIDIDGKSAYSQVRRVNRDFSVKEFNLYPNPALNSIISFQGSFLAKGNYKLSIVSINGQEIYRRSINHIGGTISQTIELPAKIGKGVYLVTIKDENGKYIFSERLVKK